jgi:hypothetical protein
MLADGAASTGIHDTQDTTMTTCTTCNRQRAAEFFSKRQLKRALLGEAARCTDCIDTTPPPPAVPVVDKAKDKASSGEALM